MARQHRDPGRKPKITSAGQPVEEDNGLIVTTAGAGRMTGSIPPKQRTPEEDAPPMPTPTKPLSTATPS